jgi:CHASE2 domain-containing sensor protein
MTRLTDARPDNRPQYQALSLLALGAIAATAILSLSGGTPFQPYLGNLNPLLAVLLVTALGFVSLGFLHSHGWFDIYAGRKSLKGTTRGTMVVRYHLVVSCGLLHSVIARPRAAMW